jgi:hypothetical protein
VLDLVAGHRPPSRHRRAAPGREPGPRQIRPPAHRVRLQRDRSSRPTMPTCATSGSAALRLAGRRCAQAGPCRRQQEHQGQRAKTSHHFFTSISATRTVLPGLGKT